MSGSALAITASAVNNMFYINCDWMIKGYIKGQSPTSIKLVKTLKYSEIF